MTPLKRANTLKHSSRIGHPLELVAARRALSATTVDSAGPVPSNSFITQESENNGEPISVDEPNTALPTVVTQERPQSETRKV